MTADWAVLSLVGPSRLENAAKLGATLAPVRVKPVPPAKFASANVEQVATSSYPGAALEGGGYARAMSYGVDLLVPRANAPAVADALGVPLAGLWAFEALRVADRRPRLGHETDHRTLPAEVGWLAGAVHLDKGCYRGQETVARVHNLGRPPRKLVLLHLDGVTTDELPAQGTPVVTDDGRSVGFVGTAARHFELGQVALALAKQNLRPTRGSWSPSAAIDLSLSSGRASLWAGPAACRSPPRSRPAKWKAGGHDDDDVDHGCPSPGPVGQGGRWRCR